MENITEKELRKKGSKVKHLYFWMLLSSAFAIFLHSHNKHFRGPLDSGVTAYMSGRLVVNDQTLGVETFSTHLDILKGQSKIFCIK